MTNKSHPTEQAGQGMVERVARALGDVAETHGQQGQLRARRPSDAMLEAQARAAIEAMREPTEAMLLANTRAEFDWAATDRNVALVEYQAMIDAALHDGTSE